MRKLQCKECGHTINVWAGESIKRCSQCKGLVWKEVDSLRQRDGELSDSKVFKDRTN